MQNAQLGRSMIEMLGVLAIVGVLSVGGLFGFAEAMMQYRVNRTVEQVIEISSRIAQIGEQSGTYKGLSNAVAVKMKAVPNGVTVDGSNNMTNLFGGAVLITPSGLLTNSDEEAFAIVYTGLSAPACMRLAAQNWQSGQSGSLIGVGFGAGDVATSLQNALLLDCNGVGCAKKLPISVSDATTSCNCAGDTCVMVAKYY